MKVKISTFLMGGLAVGLLISQSLMDMFLVLTTLWGLWLALTPAVKESSPSPNRQNSEDYRAVHNRYAKIWSIFAGLWFVWILAGLFFKNPEYQGYVSILKELTWFLQLPFLVMIWRQIQPQQSQARFFLTVLAVASAYAVALYFVGFDPLMQTWQDRIANIAGFWRTGGFFSNPMPLAHTYGPLASALIPLFLYQLYSLAKGKADKTSAKPSRLLAVALLLTLLTVLFTFTRGIWLSLALATLVGAFLFHRRLGFISVGLLCLASVLLMVSWPKFRERTLQSFDPQKSYDSERLILWKANWMIFLDNPILGVGYGENKTRLRAYYDKMNLPANQFTSHAHNQFIHFIAGTGSVGLLFYMVCLGYFLMITHRLYRHYQDSGEIEWSLLMLGLLMAQLTFHGGSLTESNFSIAKNRNLMVFLWSFIAFKYLEMKAKDQTPR